MKKKHLRGLLSKARTQMAEMEQMNRKLVRKIEILNAYAGELRSLHATIKKAKKIKRRPNPGYRYR